jgi:hypothetical protein
VAFVAADDAKWVEGAGSLIVSLPTTLEALHARHRPGRRRRALVLSLLLSTIALTRTRIHPKHTLAFVFLLSRVRAALTLLLLLTTGSRCPRFLVLLLFFPPLLLAPPGRRRAPVIPATLLLATILPATLLMTPLLVPALVVVEAPVPTIRTPAARVIVVAALAPVVVAPR